MRQDHVSIADIDVEHRVRERFHNDSLELDYIVFCHLLLNLPRNLILCPGV